MCDEDLQKMVSVTLGRFNKKLTVSNHEKLGNQMELLISKNKSPLYITAACEALRKFGIYEEVSGYIQNLPSNVQDLFSFLLDEWSEEYGKEIVEDIAGFLYVSRVGLLENEINDLLRFKENALKGPDGLLYQSSFSRLYDSLKSFLSSGGGGYLRFFHDQLKYTVKKKYMNAEEVIRLFHEWLFKFYYNVIEGQIQLKPNKEPCAYYEHALQQIVYHQLQSVSPKESLSSLHLTLRNLYFVRECVTNDQTHFLNQEYMDAIEKSNSDDEIMALREWAQFAQVYASAINEFPEFCHNMAINQSVTSKVRVDTEQLPAPDWSAGFPFIWTNNPNEIDPMVATYSYIDGSADGVSCVASTPEGDICCAVNGQKAVIFDQSSGDVLQEMEVKGYSLTLSLNLSTLYIGENEGYVSLWDVNTGTLTSRTENHLDGCVVWLELIDDWLLCGTGSLDKEICFEGEGPQISQISLFYVEDRCFSRTWSTESPGFSFCYHENTKLIFSGHQGFIKAWNLEGELQFTLVDAGHVFSLSAHPNKDILLSGSGDSNIRQWSITNRELSHSFLDPCEHDTKWYLEISGGNWCVQYDAQGTRILSTEPSSHSVRVYTLEGILQDEIKGHDTYITSISLVPGCNLVLTADITGKLILWNLPPLDEDIVKDISESIDLCDFLPNGDEYITLSRDFIRLWETNTNTLVRSATLTKLEMDLETFETLFSNFDVCGAVHPSGEYFALGKDTDICWYKISDLIMSHSFEVSSVSKIKFSPDGLNLVAVNGNLAAIPKVFDVTDIMEPKERLHYKEHSQLRVGDGVTDCDIHSDNVQVMTCDRDFILIWSIVTGETFHRIENYGCSHVRFFLQTQKILYNDRDNNLMIRDLNEDNNTVTLSYDRKPIATCLYENESLVASAGEDGVVRVFDTTTGNCLYGFYHSQAQAYTSLAIHPSKKLILAANSNGVVYALKPEQYCTEK